MAIRSLLSERDESSTAARADRVGGAHAGGRGGRHRRARGRDARRARPAFVAAVELIRDARGRVIVTGMGKSGHVGRKIAATFASTGTPAFFVHPSEASHGDLGMITPDDVIMALSWSGETAELKDLIDYSRRFRIGLIAVTAAADSTLGAGRRRRAGAAAGARSLPAQPRAHHLDADAGRARRRARGRAAGEPRLHRARFRHVPSGRPARRACSSSCATSCIPATRCRSRRSARRMSEAIVEMSRQGLRLRRHHRPRRAARRHHHRRRPAPAHAPRPARPRASRTS